MQALADVLARRPLAIRIAGPNAVPIYDAVILLTERVQAQHSDWDVGTTYREVMRSIVGVGMHADYWETLRDYPAEEPQISP